MWRLWLWINISCPQKPLMLVFSTYPDHSWPICICIYIYTYTYDIYIYIYYIYIYIIHTYIQLYAHIRVSSFLNAHIYSYIWYPVCYFQKGRLPTSFVFFWGMGTRYTATVPRLPVTYAWGWCSISTWMRGICRHMNEQNSAINVTHMWFLEEFYTDNIADNLSSRMFATSRPFLKTILENHSWKPFLKYEISTSSHSSFFSLQLKKGRRGQVERPYPTVFCAPQT